MHKEFFICFLLIAIYRECYSHTHHLHNSHKEREEDGARSPRDHSHFNDGEHKNEFDHESILGSVKEAEEFDDLPPAEAKRRLEILLKKMDRNKDISIDQKELHSWILRSFRMLSEEESEERMEEVDEDEDGVVTWEEYISETYGIKDPEDIPLLEGTEREDEQKLLQEDRQLFNAADENLDGRLNAKEFLAFSHPEEDPKMLPVILQQTLDDKDGDKDGIISFQEFIGDKGKDHDKEWLLSEKDKFDHEYDKDGDGVLTRNEILGWVVPSNEDIASDEVDHLFASSDDDGDGLLSFAEILTHHEIFVGSEATDYGDHLQNLDRFEDEL
ncbi:UNVERIFIED_CONTAM: hypothetical protein GTU68_006569 [Idotea baltica]|nr:hypothetical protein [Idotea baltica]